MTISWSYSPDPAGELAQQAAADVRSLFTARVGESPDSHATWNTETGIALNPLVNGVAQRAAEGDYLAAARFAGEWAGTYLAASSLLSEQLLRAAIARAYIASGEDPEDNERAVEFMIDWQNAITKYVFAMLVEEGRTLV